MAPDLLTRSTERAADVLRAGGLAAVPTETVYGLAADALQPGAVARIYAVKGRPADHPLIVHLLAGSEVDAWAREVPAYAGALAEAFWPGPLTLVLRRSARAGDHVTGGQDTVGLRVPAHPAMRDVLRALGPGAGLAAPSANRFGRVSPTTAAHVLHELAGLLVPGRDVVLDGGVAEVGVESTIVDCTGPQPRLLRPGGVGGEQVAAATGLPLGTGSTARAPGTLASHYAPAARVRLVPAQDVVDQPPGCAVTGLLAPSHVPTPVGVVRLAAPADATGYARCLYAALREADALGLAQVLAVPPEDDGPLATAVRDRLTRAAHGG